MKTLAAPLFPLLAVMMAASASALGTTPQAPAGAPAATPAAGAPAGSGSQPDCANSSAAFQPQACPSNGDANARALAEDMIKQSGMDFGPDKALAQQRHDQLLGSLTQWIEARPQDAVTIERALASGKTGTFKDGNGNDLKQFLRALNGNVNNADASKDLINETTELSDYAEHLTADSNTGGNIEDVKARLGKSFDGSVAAPPGPNPAAGSVAGGADGLKGAMVSGDQSIAGVPTRHVYGDGGQALTGPKGQDLELQVRNDPTDPAGLYVDLSDVSNIGDIHGQTVLVSPGVAQTVILKGQAYLVKVTATSVDDGNGGKRDDYQVEVHGLKDTNPETLAAAAAAANGSQTEQGHGGFLGFIGKIFGAGPAPKDEGQLLGAATLFGPQGLLAQRVREVYDDAHDPDPHVAEMHTTWLGQGKDRRRYYVAVQGGSTVSYVLYDADALDQAHAALLQYQNGAPSDSSKLLVLSPSQMVPTFIVPFADCNSSGVGVPYSKENQPPIFIAADADHPAYHYVRDPSAPYQMMLVPMTQDEVDSYCTTNTSTPGCSGYAAAAGAGSGSGSDVGSGSSAGPASGGGSHGGDANAPDRTWPDKIRSDDFSSCMKSQPANANINDVKNSCTYSLRQAGVNAELKKIIARYRLYVNDAGAFFLVSPNPGRDNEGVSKVRVSSVTMQANQVLVPAASDARASIAHSGADTYLRISSKSKGFAYYFDIASPVADPKDPKSGLVGYADQAQSTPLDVKRRGALSEILTAAGFSESDAQAIDGKATQALSSGGEFAEINESQGEIDLYLNGSDNPVKLWPEGDGTLPKGGGVAAKPGRARGKKAGSGSTSADLYAMNESHASQGANLPAEAKLDGGKLKLYKFPGSDYPAGAANLYGAWYRDQNATKWYRAFVVYVPKDGVALKDATLDSDLVALHTTYRLMPYYSDDMKFKPVVVRNAADAENLHIAADEIHKGAFAAYLGAPTPTNKYGQFIQHVAWVGQEPNAAEDGPSAFAGDASAMPDTDWHVLHPSSWHLGETWKKWWNPAPSQPTVAGPAAVPMPTPNN